jgi:hypothetical protein
VEGQKTSSAGKGRESDVASRDLQGGSPRLSVKDRDVVGPREKVLNISHAGDMCPIN